VDRLPEIGGMKMATGRTTKRLLTTAMSGLLATASLLVIASTGTAGASPVRPSVLGTVPTGLTFGGTTLGTYTGPDTFVVTNNGGSTDTIDMAGDGLSFSGPGDDDYLVVPESSCPGNGTTTVVLVPSASCSMDVYFYPGALGSRPATITIKGSADTTGTTVQVTGTGAIGYYQVDQFGDVAHAGDAGYYGDASNLQLNKPIVAITPTGNDGGYWLVASDGGIFSYGSADFYGSAGDIALNQPIVGMAATRDGRGYWLVASDGGIFSYGDAPFYGSAGDIALNQPIVGMAVTPDGGGYWLVASDGGIFSYGDAGFYGSAGDIALNQPIVGMAATPDGRGYWLVASDGGIFSYGDATFYGSAGDVHLDQPIVSMAAMPDGGGYWFSAVDGGLFNYGSAPFYGSGVGLGLGPIVDMATDGGPTLQAANDIPAIRRVDLAQLRRSGHLPLQRMAGDGS
jgi:hypothetical protein